jgi:hypothetical protein
MRVKTSRKAGLLVVVLVVGVAIGLLSNSGGPSSSEAGPRASVALSQAQERYGLLRRERTEADEMLAAPNSAVGQDPEQARRARLGEAGWRIWAVPNNDGICVEGLHRR